MKADVAAALELASVEPERVVGRLTFPPDLAIFDGHFPGFPIVPGIYLVEAARLLAQEAVRGTLSIQEITNARFTGEVHPGVTVEATATLTTSDDRQVLCEAGFVCDGTAVARIKIRMRRG